MSEITVGVQKEFCAECSLALRRFIGKMDGVNSIDVEGGRIVVQFDEKRLSPEDILTLTKDSIEKLGYRLTDREGEVR